MKQLNDNSQVQHRYFYIALYTVAVQLVLFQDSVHYVLVQVDKHIRHPLLLEQPTLQAAISSWHTDFELQEIFRKGETSCSLVFLLYSWSTSMMCPLQGFILMWSLLFLPPTQISNIGCCSVDLKSLNLELIIRSIWKMWSSHDINGDNGGLTVVTAHHCVSDAEDVVDKAQYRYCRCNSCHTSCILWYSFRRNDDADVALLFVMILSVLTEK